MHDVTISPVLNGWIVRVGCQTVTFNDRRQLIRELDQYLEDPQKQIEHYLKDSVNAEVLRHRGPQAVVAEQPRYPAPPPPTAAENYAQALQGTELRRP